MTGRLLFLSHRLPYPPHSGAAVRTFNILRELSRGFTVDALCFDRQDPATAHQPLGERIAALRPYASCEVFPIPQQESATRLLSDHARSLLSGRPYTWYLHDSRAMLEHLADRLRDHSYQVIHVDSLDLVRLLPLLPLDRVACTHHNIESSLLARRALRDPHPVRRAYLRLQAARLAATERYWAPKVAINLCTSIDDLDALRALAPAAHGAVVPNGVDDDYFSRPEGPRGGGLVFVGGTTWHPNRDALEWFVDRILPGLRAAGMGCQVTWVGRVSEQERKAFEQLPGFTLTGYVEDVRPYLARADAFVAPIRVGGGTRLKILDAWAMAVPVIGTRSAMEGLGAVEGDSFLLAESPEEFIVGIRRLLEQPGLGAALAARGRELVERNFAWRSIGATLRSLYADFPVHPASPMVST